MFKLSKLSEIKLDLKILQYEFLELYPTQIKQIKKLQELSTNYVTNELQMTYKKDKDLYDFEVFKQMIKLLKEYMKVMNK